MKKISIQLLFSGLALSILFLSGCEKAAWEKQERLQIADYIKSLGDTIYDLKPSGLYYIELIPGTGVSPVIGDTVSIFSRGCLLDHTQFTSNYGEASPYEFVLGANYVHKGINEGLTYMKEGGISKLVLPSKLAYGNYGYALIIPGYTPLYYQVTLVKVKPGPH